MVFIKFPCRNRNAADLCFFSLKKINVVIKKFHVQKQIANNSLAEFKGPHISLSQKYLQYIFEIKLRVTMPDAARSVTNSRDLMVHCEQLRFPMHFIIGRYRLTLTLTNCILEIQFEINMTNKQFVISATKSYFVISLFMHLIFVAYPL